MSPLTRTKVAPPKRTPPWVRGLLWYGPLAVLCLAAFGVTYAFFVDAPPPKTLVIATGSKEGAYYKYALRYAEILKKDGITLEVRETKGTVENLALLQDDQSKVSLAIVQGGVADENAAEKLVALGSLYREPLWIFYRGEQTIDMLGQLAGKSIAIGPEGSGTRKIAEHLLKDNGITARDATFLPTTGKQAADDLEEGKIDAVFFVAAVEASYVQQLLKIPNDSVRLVSLAQQAAYDRRYHFLSPVTVPVGLIDLGRNVPAKETKLVAPTAMLVTRKDIHPALVPLLLHAATEVHRGGDLLANSNEFPTALYTDLPVDEDARQCYKNGPPVLQRILPFWLATLVDRLKVMLIPIVMLLMPMFRFAPPLVRWRNRRKVYLWYNLLRDIEEKVGRGITHAEIREELAKLYEIERELPNLDVPLGYMGEFYTMRFHLTLVREQLEKLQQEHTPAPEALA